MQSDAGRDSEIHTHEIRYTGPALFESLVEQTLRNEGLDVLSSSGGPADRELRDAFDVLMDATTGVAVVYIVRGTDAVIRAAVAKARKRLSNREKRLSKIDKPGTIEIDDDMDDEDA